MKDTRKGFTLVELLAVIVILAIIMIIAIPSVLGTMTTARKKSFTEYVTKVYTKAQEVYAQGNVTGTPIAGKPATFNGQDVVVYDINDLFDNVGSNHGWVAVQKPTGEMPKPRFFVAIYDDSYILTQTVDIKNDSGAVTGSNVYYYYEYTKEPSTSDLEDYVTGKGTVVDNVLTGVVVTANGTSSVSHVDISSYLLKTTSARNS